MKTTAEAITKRLQQAFVRQYYDSLQKQACQAFGDADSTVATHASSVFPHYQDIRLQIQEKGVTNKILNTQFLILSKVLRSSPEPDFVGIDKYSGEVLKQFLIARSRGTGSADGEWLSQHTDTFLAGDGFGAGFTQVLPKTDPKTGFRRIHARHVPTTQMIWDRYERSFTRANYAACAHYLPTETAVSLFGNKVRKHAIEMRASGDTYPLEVVRIFEYYDIGTARTEPTMAYIPGDIDQDPIEVMANELGIIPVAGYEHLIRPGMARPTGRIALLLADQDMTNEAERYMRSQMRKQPIDLLDPDIIDETDLDDINSGIFDQRVAKLKEAVDKDRVPSLHIPGGEITQAMMVAVDHFERNFNANAGINDFDRGNLSAQNRTLGENELLDERSKTQSNWSVMQLALYFRRFYEVCIKVASLADDEPVAIDAYGAQVTLNDPNEPASAIANFCNEPHAILIDEQNLFKGDQVRESQQKLSALSGLAALVPAIAQTPWFMEQVVDAGGYDKREVLPQLQEAMMAQQQAAQQGSLGPMPTQAG